MLFDPFYVFVLCFVLLNSKQSIVFLYFRDSNLKIFIEYLNLILNVLVVKIKILDL